MRLVWNRISICLYLICPTSLISFRLLDTVFYKTTRWNLRIWFDSICSLNARFRYMASEQFRGVLWWGGFNAHIDQVSPSIMINIDLQLIISNRAVAGLDHSKFSKEHNAKQRMQSCEPWNKITSNLWWRSPEPRRSRQQPESDNRNGYTTQSNSTD